jgi:glycosyltransferase involved in cell wall biosynthesis
MSALSERGTENLEREEIRNAGIPDVSVVIPVYRAAKTLDELTTRLVAVLRKLSADYEIIMVEDCGGDESWEVMKKLRAADRRVKIIRLMKNFGQHNALMCGFRFATGEYIVTLDDDLQNPPEEIPRLLEKIKEGYDLVYGEYISKKHSSFRNAGSSMIQFFYQKIFSVSGKLTAFRIMRRDIVKSISAYDRNYVFIDGLLAWVTRNIGYVPVEHEERKLGSSGYGLKKLFTLSMNMVTNFSILPLQVASVLGFGFAFIGFLMAIYFFIKKVFFDIPVTGYTSLMTAITIFAGIQLVTLGLIGEYVGRIHLNINAKPQFLIREKEIS